MEPGTVRAKVRAAHRGRLLLIAVESAIVGSSSAIATLAAGAAARVDPGDPQTATLLALVGILGAVSWWMERRGDAASVARAIDRRSGWEGALTTAFETESTSDRSPVAAALAQQLAPRVSPWRFLAGESRASAAVLAAPFLATALLAVIQEGKAPSLDPRAPGAATAGSRAADLRSRALRLAAEPGASAREVAALESIAERATRVGASISDVEFELAALERDLGRPGASAAGAGVASAGPDGTMGGRAPGVDRPPADPMREPSPSTSPADAGARGRTVTGAEGGVGAPRWWPERYDGVVERWIEARRAAQGGRSR